MALTDTSSHPPPTSGGQNYNADVRPSLGATFTDTTFGTTIRRMSASPASIYADYMYSHCLVSRNGTYAIIRTATESSGGMVIKQVADAAVVASAQPAGGQPSDVQWSADDDESYFYFSGSTLRYRRITGTPADTDIKTFGGTLGAMGGSVNICDKTGRYWVLNVGGTKIVWDRTEDAIYTGTIAAGNWTGITPSGNHVVVAEGGTNKRVWFYPLNHGTNTVGSAIEVWRAGGTHGIPVSGSDGNDYLIMSSGINGDPDGLYRISVEDRSGMTPNQQVADSSGVELLLERIGYTWDVHMSHGPLGDGQDHVFVFTEATTTGIGRDNFDDVPNVDNTWVAYKQEALDIDYMNPGVAGSIRRLCHHRSRSISNGYGNQPHNTCSWDGSVLMFGSNFNDSSPSEYTDHYLIEDALGTGAPGPEIVHVGTMAFR